MPYNPIPGYYLSKFKHERGEIRKENQNLGRMGLDLHWVWQDKKPRIQIRPAKKRIRIRPLQPESGSDPKKPDPT